MGDYETLDVDYSLAADVEPSETKEEVFNTLYDWVSTEVGKEMKKAKDSSRVNTVRKRAGKVVE